MSGTWIDDVFVMPGKLSAIWELMGDVVGLGHGDDAVEIMDNGDSHEFCEYFIARDSELVCKSFSQLGERRWRFGRNENAVDIDQDESGSGDSLGFTPGVGSTSSTCMDCMPSPDETACVDCRCM